MGWLYKSRKQFIRFDYCRVDINIKRHSKNTSIISQKALFNIFSKSDKLEIVSNDIIKNNVF